MSYPLRTTFVICAILFCTNISGTTSIINGRNPKLNEVKYIVAVVGKGVCSGGIMGNKHVLTAAHCIRTDANNKLKPIKVIAVTNSSSKYDPNVSIVKYVKRAFILNAYAKNIKKIFHDIAVLELSGSIQIDKNSDKLQQLDLPAPVKSNPPTHADHVGKKFTAVGFGKSKAKWFKDDKGRGYYITWGPGRLQVANAVVLNNKNCINVYGNKMQNRMCVAIIEDPTKTTFQGICSGDSGSPIVVDDTVLVGVNTAAGNCNNNVNPGMAVKTTAFMDFIKNAMNGTITSDMKVYDAS